MLLEGIRQAIKQGVSLPAVMRLLLTERRQSLELPHLILPATLPRATCKHPVSIGACHKSPCSTMGVTQPRCAGDGNLSLINRKVCDHAN